MSRVAQTHNECVILDDVAFGDATVHLEDGLQILTDATVGQVTHKQLGGQRWSETGVRQVSDRYPQTAWWAALVWNRHQTGHPHTAWRAALVWNRRQTGVRQVTHKQPGGQRWSETGVRQITDTQLGGQRWWDDRDDRGEMTEMSVETQRGDLLSTWRVGRLRLVTARLLPAATRRHLTHTTYSLHYVLAAHKVLSSLHGVLYSVYNVLTTQFTH